MNVLRAFIVRDISLERNYRLHFAVKSVSVFFQLAIFFFISRFMEAPEYFPFVFAGLVFSRFFHFWLTVFSENIRQEQYWGTAEALFLSPAPPLKVLLVSSAGKFMLLMLELLVYLAAGAVIFGVQFSARALLLLPLFIIGAAAFGGLGLLSGSLIMYFKRGDPVNWFVGTSFDLLSGVYFPLAVLPQGVQLFARYLPTTSALALWRNALLSGGPIPAAEVWMQLAWALVLVSLGVVSFRAAFRKTRENGELGSY